jgi:hypothetical protein
MAIGTLTNGTVSMAADVATPDAQPSVNGTLAVVAGSQLNAGPFRTVAYTFRNSGSDTISYAVTAAILADYSDERTVDAGAIAAAALDDYSVDPAPFVHYRVKVADAVSGSHGAMVVAGVAK